MVRFGLWQDARNPAFCNYPDDPRVPDGRNEQCDAQQTAHFRTPTGCKAFCAAAFQREGDDDTCMPDVPECNNWLAPDTKGLWRASQLPEKAWGSWGGSFYTIPKGAKNKALAWDFIQMMTLDFM